MKLAEAKQLVADNPAAAATIVHAAANFIGKLPNRIDKLWDLERALGKSGIKAYNALLNAFPESEQKEEPEIAPDTQ